MARMNSKAVVKVGSGRGFVVEALRQLADPLRPRADVFLDERVVVTAAHCLPHLPPCYSFSDLEERTYPSLLGPLGSTPTVWAECLFVNPIADIAVLGSPDYQDLSEESDAYEAFVDQASTLAIADCAPNQQAWLLSRKGQWFACCVKRQPTGLLWIENAAQNIVGGMSGSPILAEDGSAIGVLCTSNHNGNEKSSREGGPQPCLTRDLPGWALRQISRSRKPRSGRVITARA